MTSRRTFLEVAGVGGVGIGLLGCGDSEPSAGTDASLDADSGSDASVDGGSGPDSSLDAGPGPDSGAGADTCRPSGPTPVLCNFRIEPANKDRVMFDASGDVSGMTRQGFVISTRTVTGLTIDRDGLGGYLSVDTPFDFWDNSHIRLGGLDGSDSGDGTVFDFTMQYVVNNIPEPTASDTRYVSLTGDDDNDGVTEETAWRTITKAAATATAGTTVWIEAGNYGAENVVVRNSGDADNPIKFIGYRDAVGDDPSLGWDYSRTRPWEPSDPLARVNGFDAAEMPLISGTDESMGRGFECISSFVIVKNLQVEHYQRLFTVNGARDAVWYDNCYSSNGVYNFLIDSAGTTRVRVTRCLGFRAATVGIRIYGDYNKVENCQIWDDRDDLSDVPLEMYSLDYYVGYRGMFNIVRGCRIERVGNTTHTGHGYSCKDSSGGIAEYNLLENSTARGISLSIEYWHPGVQRNVARDIHVDRDESTLKRHTGGVDILRDSSNNVFESLYVNNTARGVYFTTSGSTGNVFRNCVFSNSTASIRVDTPNSGNRFHNCTFYNNENVAGGAARGGAAMEFRNCIFANVPTNGSDASVFESCDFHGGFPAPAGPGNLSEEPLFVDERNNDLRLQAASVLRNAGVALADVKYDHDQVERVADMVSIGAYERD